MLSSYRPTHCDALSILESDDELPDSYEETSEIPAYLNDSRFNHIELPWLRNCKPVRITNKPIQQEICQEQTPVQAEKENIEKPIIINQKSNKKILISQGILSKRDLFYVRSIEDYCSESTLLWFIESLKAKSEPNRFRISCLARDYCYVDSNDDKPILMDRFIENYYFNLVVSK